MAEFDEDDIGDSIVILSHPGPDSLDENLTSLQEQGYVNVPTEEEIVQNLEKATLKIQELVKENNELKDTIQTNSMILKGELTRIEERNNHISLTEKSVQQKFENAKTKMKGLHQRIEKKEKQIKENEQQIKELEQQLAKMRSNEEEFTLTIGELRKNLTDLTANTNDKEIDIRDQQLRELEQQLLKMKCSEDASKEKVEELKTQVTDLTAKHKKASEASSFLELKNSELSEELENVKIRMETAAKQQTPEFPDDSQLTILKQKFRELKDTNRELKTANKDLHTRNEKYEAEIFRLKSSNTAYQKETETHQQSLKKVKEMSESLMVENEELKKLSLNVTSMATMGYGEEKFMLVSETKPPGGASPLMADSTAEDQEMTSLKWTQDEIMKYSVSDLWARIQEEQKVANELKEQLERKDYEIDSLKVEIETKEKEMKEIYASLESKLCEINGDSLQKEQLQNRETGMSVTEEERMSYISKQQSLEQEIRGERGQNQELRATVESYKQRCTELQKNLATEKQEIKNLRHIFENDRKSLQILIESKEAVAKAEEYKAKRAEEKLVELSDKYKKASKELQVREKEDEMLVKCMVASDQTDAKKQRIKELEEIIKEKDEIIQTFQFQAEVHKSDFEQERTERTEMHSKIDADHAKLHQDILTKEERINRLQNEVRALRTQFDEATQRRSKWGIWSNWK